MSDNTGNGGPEANPRARRGSISQVALSQLFNRGNSANGGGFPASNDAQRRRLSVTTVGLSGSVPNQPPNFGMRRSSMSTNNSDSIDESAIEDDDGTKTTPNTPFVRRMSFGGSAMRGGYRPNGSPGNESQGFNWSEQLRSRAESSVSGARPSISAASTSPPRGGLQHDRAKSISDMPQPPVRSPPPKQESRKPDAFQERILKGDFYMD